MMGHTPETPEGSGRNNDNTHNTSIEQIQNHITTLKALIHEHNSGGGTPIKPIQLDFDEEESQDDGAKGNEEQPLDDLSKPFKVASKSPFTQRIINFSGPKNIKYTMPSHLKLYDGSADPDDHITRFEGAANQGAWPMPIWCMMFQQTLDDAARGWFDRLPRGTIDSWGTLSEQFIQRFALRRKCIRDPMEITNMGLYDLIYSFSDGVKSLLTPDLTSVKRATDGACSYTTAVVANIDKVVRVEGIQKLPEYWPDGGQIGLFTTTLAKNAGKYAVYEGFKHIPGVTVASKLLSDTMHEVNQEMRKGGMNEMAEMRAKVENLEKEFKKTSSSMPENFNQNGNIRSQSANEGGTEKTKVVIDKFMRTEFIGNHMFDDLMVPKIGRMEKKIE